MLSVIKKSNADIKRCIPQLMYIVTFAIKMHLLTILSFSLSKCPRRDSITNLLFITVMNTHMQFKPVYAYSEMFHYGQSHLVSEYNCGWLSQKLRNIILKSPFKTSLRQSN